MRKLMKRLICTLIVIFIFLFSSISFAKDVYVRGYTKSNGTYVHGYHRSSPNQYKYDNYSSQGNTNPYTGQKGYQRNEYSSPPSYNKSYNSSPSFNNSNSLFNNSNTFQQQKQPYGQKSKKGFWD